MRKPGRAAASLLLLLLATGCELGGSGSGGSGSSGSPGKGGLAASPPPAYLTRAQALADSRAEPFRDAVGPAPSGGADAGRVVFDGAAVGGGDPGAVTAGPGSGRDPNAAVNAAPRKDTLRVLEPPAPGAGSSTVADFSGVKFNPELKDADRRREILARAKDFLGIPYKFGADSRSGMDCSAFVSRAWGIERHGTSTISRASYKITADELEPGDALNLTIDKSESGYGHIRLFVGWADASKSEVWIAEASGPGKSAYRKVKYSKAYQPIRRKDLPRAVAMKDRTEELLKPRILLVGDSHSTGGFGKTLDKRLRETYKDFLVETYASCGASSFWFLPGHKSSGKASHCGTFVARYDETGSAPRLVKSSAKKPAPMMADIMRPETDLVIVELGANSTAWAEVMAETIVRYGARCVWIGVPPTRDGPRDAVNAELKRKVSPYCDFVESTVPYEGNDSQGVHYSAAGGAKWGEQSFEAVKALLRDQGPAAP